MTRKPTAKKKVRTAKNPRKKPKEVNKYILPMDGEGKDITAFFEQFHSIEASPLSLKLIDAVINQKKPAEVLGLIKQGADVNARDPRNDARPSSLHYACQNQNKVLVHALLFAGAEPNIYCPGLGYPLSYVAEHVHNAEIAELLIKAGARVDLEDENGDTPLHKLLKSGDTELCSVLLKYGVSPKAKVDRKPLIHIAALHGQAEIVKLLLKAGAKANAKNDEDETPFQAPGEDSQDYYSSHEAKDRVICVLAKADPNLIKDKYLLHWAASWNYPETIKMLLSEGRDINLQDESGLTALHEAANGHAPEAARVLLEAEADPDLKDKDGWTPYRTVVEDRHEALQAIFSSFIKKKVLKKLKSTRYGSSR